MSTATGPSCSVASDAYSALIKPPSVSASIPPTSDRAHTFRSVEARSVRVRAVIERPPPLAWVCDLPFPERVDWWPGSLLSWPWIDRERRTWTALVRYQREGLLYEHWVNGDLLAVADERTVCGWA